MRRLRIAIVALFILSGISFVGYNVISRLAEDHTSPEISCDSDTVSVSVEDEEIDEALLSGVKASDNEDGDLTDQIRVSSMSNFTEPGKRTITYAVFDKAGQAATLQRTLEYTDYTSPQILLTAPLRYSLEDMADVNLTENMSVEDCLDGDLTSQIRATFNDSIYIQQAGEYPVTVQVSNSAGDTCSVPLTLTVTDSSDSSERDKYYPLLSQYIVYTNAGEQVDLAGLLTGFERNGAEYLFTDPDAASLPGARENVSISGDVDWATAGTYNVDYQFTSAAGVTATTKLAVVVR